MPIVTFQWEKYLLPESRLYNFLDSKYGFNLHFLEGQQLINELAVLHPLSGKGFFFFRDAILTFQPLISFLKAEEGIGLYIDSEQPKFGLKLESHSSGHTRTLLMPTDFQDFPTHLTGKCRLSKILPESKRPYNSIIDLNNTSLLEIVNKILNESYQLQSTVFISQISDQSIMLSKLPHLGGQTGDDFIEKSLTDYLKENKSIFDDLFKLALTNEEEIIKEFERLGFQYLASKVVQFKCPCSRERMITNLQLLGKEDRNTIFLQDNSIEVRCDYCNTYYLIEEKDLQ